MKIKKLWAIYVEKYPSFAGDPNSTIRLTVRGFKKFFDETYSHAHNQGWNSGLEACQETISKLKEENERLRQQLIYANQRLQQRDAAGKGGGLEDILKDIFK